jgi:antitoxin component YwqK of YwqJK toxin-antitoxin module
MPERPDHYDNGNPRFTGELVDGQMHGPWEFFRKDGTLMRSGTFDHDRQIGKWTTFDRSGAIVKVTDFGD